MGTSSFQTFKENPLLNSDLRIVNNSNRGEILLLDEESIRIMLRIQERMRLLAPCDDDDRRTLWIESIPGGGKRGETKMWWKVIVGYYEDIHYLAITDGRWRGATFLNKDDGNCLDSYKYDMREMLGKLNAYLWQIVSDVMKNPVPYNEYVEKNLPLTLRTGTLSRKTYRGFFPDDKWKGLPFDPEPLLRKKAAQSKTDTIEAMTLREYIRLWSIAYRAIHPEYANQADLEVFNKNSKGRDIGKHYGLDDPEEYMRWDKEQGAYHCHDVVYARVVLVPQRQREGGWYLDFGGDLEGYTEDIIKGANALDLAGISFMLRCAKEMLEDYLGEDDITFCPFGGMRSEIGGASRSFPEGKRDGLPAKRIKELASLVNWKPLRKVVSMRTLLD